MMTPAPPPVRPQSGGPPKPKARRNFTDPDSKIMLTSDGAFHQCYNARAVADADHQLIVATEVNTNAADVA
jgi:hypothetical protein